MDKTKLDIVKESVDFAEAKTIPFVLDPFLVHQETCYKHFTLNIPPNNIKLDVQICHRSKIEVLPAKTWVSLTMGVGKVTTTNSLIYELDWNTVSFTKTVHLPYKRPSSDIGVISYTDFVPIIREQLGDFEKEVEQEITNFVQIFL
jgi:hypothetical protein